MWQANVASSQHPLTVRLSIMSNTAFANLNLDVLHAQVLGLPASDRASLLDRLVMSLDIDAERDAAWTAEAAKRDAEIEDGTVAELDFDEALVQLRAELG